MYIYIYIYVYLYVIYVYKHISICSRTYFQMMYISTYTSKYIYVHMLRTSVQVRRMLANTGEIASALCMNLVVETWCVKGNMKVYIRNFKRSTQIHFCIHIKKRAHARARTFQHE